LQESFEENMTSGVVSKGTSFMARHIALAAGVVAGVASAALAESSSTIPQLTSAEFGWQSNVADWQEPPPGRGRGPIKNDPAYPYTSNAEAARTGTQPTKRIGDAKDPILKPWAAAQMQASNDEVLRGERDIPFAAQARCYPGGVPGQLLFPFEPLYFIQGANLIYMIWQRDHMVRRIFLTDRHSQHVRLSWFGDSIGHYENADTLVVDTIGLSTKNSYIDIFRTPPSEKRHVVERFTLDPDGNSLTAIATVDDPDTFNTPLTMLQRWFKVNARIKETICAESPADFFHQNLFPVPQADKPDF